MLLKIYLFIARKIHSVPSTEKQGPLNRIAHLDRPNKNNVYEVLLFRCQPHKQHSIGNKLATQKSLLLIQLFENTILTSGNLVDTGL